MTRFRLFRGDQCDDGRIRWFYVALAAVALIAGAGFASYQLGVWDEWIDGGESESALDVAPPPELEYPAARKAQPVLEGVRTARLKPAAVRDAVRPVLGKRKMGKRHGVAVTSLRGQRSVHFGSERLIPASTLKNFTSLAALQSLGGDTRFSTSVVRTRGSGPARITLVGGGDPLLAREEPKKSKNAYPDPATMTELAARTADALGADGVGRVRLRYDDSLFTGPDVHPRWEPSYISTDVTTPVSSLWVDQGVEPKTEQRTTEPAAQAAEEFAKLLRNRGINVVGSVQRRTAPDTASEVASVASPPLAEIVEHLLATSDNQSAEVVLRHLAIGENEPASFRGGVTAMTAVLKRLGIATSGLSIDDGSGLSRHNRVTLKTELAVLRAAATADNTDLRTVVSGLPVAGFSGSLFERFTAAGSYGGLGYARAKTGTLSGVHAYAGTTVDSNGAPLLFVAITNGVADKNVLSARTGLDEIASALTECSCTTAR